MKIFIFTAVAGLSLSIGTVFAAEGAGDPFPFRAPGVVTNTIGRAVLSNAMTDPYPFRGNAAAMASQQIMPTNGSEGPVQTANSLPLGFENGTVAYARRASIEKYRAAQLASQATAARVAQHRSEVAPNRG